MSNRPSVKSMIGEYRYAQIVIRDNARCAYCHTDLEATPDMIEIDHIVGFAFLKALGATKATINVSSNLVTACKACNGRKSSQSIDAFCGLRQANIVRKQALRPLPIIDFIVPKRKRKPSAKAVRKEVIRNLKIVA